MVAGSLIGQLLAHDDDQVGTLNSQLTFTIVSQNPLTSPDAFAIDAASGRIQALRVLQRRDHQAYDLNVRVTDLGSTRTVGCSTPVNRVCFNSEYFLYHSFQHRM